MESKKSNVLSVKGNRIHWHISGNYLGPKETNFWPINVAGGRSRWSLAGTQLLPSPEHRICEITANWHRYQHRFPRQLRAILWENYPRESESSRGHTLRDDAQTANIQDGLCECVFFVMFASVNKSYNVSCTSLLTYVCFNVTRRGRKRAGLICSE